jgi:Bacterial low temperature requirement A protein (LtrA)/Histidine phosphatase superfamily (branch 1)
VVKRPITTTEDQRTTFIELFFDLVFVYAVTQTVSLVHEELSWAGVGHALVVFWLVWWAWTQFTWALNSADTTHPAVEAVMLAATAVAFLMAVTVPDAFGDAGGWFAATYIAVRVVGLGVYGRVAWDDVAKRTAVRRFAVLSVGGLAAVAADGLAGGDAREPLSFPGRLEAHGLLGRLRDYPITRMLTSPALRCQQTVIPLSQRRAVPIELAEDLSVEAPAASMRRWWPARRCKLRRYVPTAS